MAKTCEGRLRLRKPFALHYGFGRVAMGASDGARRGVRVRLHGRSLRVRHNLNTLRPIFDGYASLVAAPVRWIGASAAPATSRPTVGQRS